MSEPGSGHTFRLLERLSGGDGEAADELYLHIYEELRRVAGQLMARERPAHTLQATALLNEAWMRLTKGTRIRPRDRDHFVRLAARAMRRVLVDHARKRTAGKRQAHRARELPDDATASLAMDPHELLSLDESLGRLGDEDEQALRIVELRFFSGLTLAEAGALLGLTERRAWLAWSFARGWLKRDLARGRDDA